MCDFSCTSMCMTTDYVCIHAGKHMQVLKSQKLLGNERWRQRRASSTSWRSLPMAWAQTASLNPQALNQTP